MATQRLSLWTAVLIGGCIAALAAQAQTAAPPSSRDRATPPTTPGEGSTTQPDGGNGSLSHELSRSGGVVKPPETGDRGVVTPPPTGTQSTPVIPPPGTPGGNAEVKPK